MNKGENLKDNYFLLINEILENEDPKRQKILSNKLFYSIYKSYDKWIRVTLHRYQIPYTDDWDYYNRIFFDIYEIVFVKRLKEILSRYNPNKGDFKAYFCVVVQNAIRDWLRKMKLPFYKKMKDVTEEAFRNGMWPGIYAVLGLSSKGKVDKELYIENLLESLKMPYRLVVKLKYIAYLDLNEKEIEYMANKTEAQNRDVKEKIRKLREYLVNSVEFLKSIEAAEILSSLDYRLEKQQKKLFILYQGLRESRMTLNYIESLEEQTGSLHLKEIIEMFKEERRQFSKTRSGVNYLKLSYQKEYKQMLSIKRRFEKMQKTAIKAVYLPSREIANFLGIEVNVVDTRYLRAKKMLEEIYFSKKS